MSTNRKNNIQEKILEIADSIFVLKMSLLNGEQLNDDTLPYGRFAATLENKINTLYDAFDTLYND